MDSVTNRFIETYNGDEYEAAAYDEIDRVECGWYRTTSRSAPVIPGARAQPGCGLRPFFGRRRPGYRANRGRMMRAAT